MDNFINFVVSLMRYFFLDAKRISLPDVSGEQIEFFKFMIRFRYKILLFFSILSAQFTYADDTTKGLYFSSYEVTKENRTSLLVPVSKDISLYGVSDFKFNSWNKITISFSKNAISMVVNDVKKEYTDANVIPLQNYGIWNCLLMKLISQTVIP
jgi:hypothetical protein